MKLVLKVLAVGFFLLGISGMAKASCESGYDIQTKSDDGSILTLNDGSVWRVNAADTVDTELWLTAENILVCDDGTFINTDENNEQVEVELLSR